MRPVVNLASEPSPPVAGSLSFRVSVLSPSFSSFGLLAGPLLDGSFGLLSNDALFNLLTVLCWMQDCYYKYTRLLHHMNFSQIVIRNGLIIVNLIVFSMMTNKVDGPICAFSIRFSFSPDETDTR